VSKSQYDSKSQQRILQMLRTLAGNEFHGLQPSEIAQALKCGASTVTRDLHNLREAGFAEQIPETGRWRLGPSLVQISIAFSTSLDRAHARLKEVTNRFTREPN
jgi:DNA-binding IclR family transcriptional regulator